MFTLRILTILVWAFCAQSAIGADTPAVKARVECALEGHGYFEFSAGRDRCWEPIKGKTMVPKTAIACAVKYQDGTLAVTFHFSELAKPECDNGKVATKEQYSQALPLLGSKERAFFLGHVEAK